MSANIQFLTDEEYEAIRRDVGTILSDITIHSGTQFVDGVVKINNYLIGLKDAQDKLTAYVDQKIKKYY